MIRLLMRAYTLRGALVVLGVCAGIGAIVGVVEYVSSIPPPIHAGNVSKLQFVPAHDYQETFYNQVYMGQSCSGTGTSRSCYSRYIQVPYQVTEHAPDAWRVTITAAKRHATFGVDETTFHQLKLGQFYDRKAGTQ